jgi:hypothetical protein
MTKYTMSRSALYVGVGITIDFYLVQLVIHSSKQLLR